MSITITGLEIDAELGIDGATTEVVRDFITLTLEAERNNLIIEVDDVITDNGIVVTIYTTVGWHVTNPADSTHTIEMREPRILGEV